MNWKGGGNMAWMPGVDTSRKATDGNSRLTSRPDIICLHTIVGYAPALAATFSVKANGYTWQHRDSLKQSAANLNGNDHIISIETEDHGPAFGSWSGSNVPPWTPEQIEALAKICAWGYKTHGIPLVACPNSKPGSKGIAYHRQGIDGNYDNGRVPGGEVWSSSRGKVCPGDKRIAQIPQIIKRARQIAGLEKDTGGEDELSWNEKLKDGTWTPGGDETARHAVAYIHQIQKRNENLAEQVRSLDAKVTALSSKLDKLVKPDVDEAALAKALIASGLTSGLSQTEVQAAVVAALKSQFNK